MHLINAIPLWLNLCSGKVQGVFPLQTETICAGSFPTCTRCLGEEEEQENLSWGGGRVAKVWGQGIYLGLFFKVYLFRFIYSGFAIPQPKVVVCTLLGEKTQTEAVPPR